jgi:hypothetical protein
MIEWRSCGRKGGRESRGSRRENTKVSGARASGAMARSAKGAGEKGGRGRDAAGVQADSMRTPGGLQAECERWRRDGIAGRGGRGFSGPE